VSDGDKMQLADAFRLTDRVALVTGSGRGIGAAIARTFAQAGADVVLAARTKEQLDEVAADVAAAGRRAAVIQFDMNDTENVGALVDQAITTFGRLDVVVNNAGGTSPKPLLDTSERMFERAFHFNVSSAFALSKAAIPHLLEQEGASIVNISSAMGRLRDRGFVAYGTAKAALAHMTRLMAADLSPRVRVNAIAVGSVATSALEVVLTDQSLHDAMVAGTPLRRLGQPEEIAYGALYLAAPAGAYITGKVLEIDGGLEAPNLELGLPDL
jgi:7-alpha-hydroxysteroid dehydrogenase